MRIIRTNWKRELSNWPLYCAEYILCTFVFIYIRALEEKKNKPTDNMTTSDATKQYNSLHRMPTAHSEQRTEGILAAVYL